MEYKWVIDNFYKNKSKWVTKLISISLSINLIIRTKSIQIIYDFIFRRKSIDRNKQEQFLKKKYIILKFKLGFKE